MPRWWNWYTRRSQKPVPQGIGVRVPSWAPDRTMGTRIELREVTFVTSKARESFTTESERVPSWAPECFTKQKKRSECFYFLINRNESPRANTV